MRHSARLRFALVALSLAVLAVLAERVALAQAAPNERLAQAAEAIEKGSYAEAVDLLELIADQGFVHPDASFNRAVAYLGRARSTQKEPGDLGRAAAALAETVLLRPGDAEAERLLEDVRSEIGRRRARTGGKGLVARPRLARAITGLLPEGAWGATAALGSFALAVGIALRFLRKGDALEVPSALGIGLGALLFALGAGFGLSARHFRQSSTPAVVVVEEARLLDASARPLPQTGSDGNVVPEGADVFVLERRAGLARIEWGSAEGWVVGGQVRDLTRPSELSP